MSTSGLDGGGPPARCRSDCRNAHGSLCTDSTAVAAGIVAAVAHGVAAARGTDGNPVLPSALARQLETFAAVGQSRLVDQSAHGGSLLRISQEAPWIQSFARAASPGRRVTSTQPAKKRSHHPETRDEHFVIILRVLTKDRSCFSEQDFEVFRAVVVVVEQLQSGGDHLPAL